MAIIRWASNHICIMYICMCVCKSPSSFHSFIHSSFFHDLIMAGISGNTDHHPFIALRHVEERKHGSKPSSVVFDFATALEGFFLSPPSHPLSPSILPLFSLYSHSILPRLRQTMHRPVQSSLFFSGIFGLQSSEVCDSLKA
jgi:hypothetical protein